MKLERNKIYTLDQLKQLYFNSHIGKSKIAFYKAINKMIKNGEIVRLERGFYCVEQKKNTLDVNLYYEDSNKLKAFLINRYGNDFDFIIYESTILNQFLNHLLAKTKIIVEVPNYYMEHVFFEVKDSSIFNSVLLNPNSEELYHYGDDCTIVVRPYVSKAPIDLKKHSTTIEKLFVDIVCDRFLNSFYEGAEVPTMLNDITKDYVLRYKTVVSYAKRRNAYEKLLNNLDDDTKELFRWYKKKHTH